MYYLLYKPCCCAFYAKINIILSQFNIYNKGKLAYVPKLHFVFLHILLHYNITLIFERLIVQ